MRWLLLLALPLPSFALFIDEPNIGINKMIPKAGDTVTWQVPVVNDAAISPGLSQGESEKAVFEGDVTVTIRVAREGDLLSEPVSVTRHLKLEAGQSQDIPFTWTPERNGYHRVVFELQGVDQRVTRRVAVTQHDTWFVWFGAPKRFRWCNVPTTVKDGEEAWWLRRGAIPCHWKPGVCNKDWTEEQFVNDWGSSDWIAIDEVGGPGGMTDTFIAAWKRLKQEKPEQFTAVWFMGAHRYWTDIRDLVDLFVPEVYLNYFGNHLGAFDRYFRTAREAGVMDQVIPGLGINEIVNDRKRVTCSPTKADVLRQIRYLKRTAPELRGIGFFTSDSAAPGVAEYADELCEAYFVKPVITIANPEDPFRLKPRDDKMTQVCVTIRNVGGMDAKDVGVSLGLSNSVERVFDIPAGGEYEVSFGLDSTGATTICCRITPDERYTLLDGEARCPVFVRTPETADGAVLLIPPGPPLTVPIPWLLNVPDNRPVEVADMLGSTKRPLSAPWTLLPGRPGTKEAQVAIGPLSGLGSGRALVATPVDTTVRGGNAAPVGFARDAKLVTITTDHYTAELDPAADVLTSIIPVGCEKNVFREGWRLDAPGHTGFGETRVTELPGALVVTIPFDSPQASGESQYVFFSYTPAIRIARSWVPKGEVEVEHAGDKCSLPQAGGTFALQAGVGAATSRGRLHDGSDYRDLLFGYLGDTPRPDNADKAGWLDLSYKPEFGGGLGVAIEYRWEDSVARPEVGYDVTRLYDASDWLEVLYDWGQKQAFTRPQKSCVWLIPHGTLDFTDEAVTPPAQALWRRLHARQLAAIGE